MSGECTHSSASMVGRERFTSSYIFKAGRLIYSCQTKLYDVLVSTTGYAMLKYAIIFALIALVAGALGFGGIAAGAAGIAKILFGLFLILAVIFVVLAALGVGAVKKIMK